jgi:hypothetical protein
MKQYSYWKSSSQGRAEILSEKPYIALRNRIMKPGRGYVSSARPWQCGEESLVCAMTPNTMAPVLPEPWPEAETEEAAGSAAQQVICLRYHP